MTFTQLYRFGTSSLLCTGALQSYSANPRTPSSSYTIYTLSALPWALPAHTRALATLSYVLPTLDSLPALAVVSRLCQLSTEANFPHSLRSYAL
ncbi:hypothetical protein BGX38DRAFT_1236114 [Terfezia claveryi]|nr:hypothetical protein BGX38DRAFT_1236114 [Terfezia claveryi]